MAVVCDLCSTAGAYRVTIARAGKNLANMDICDGCVERLSAMTPRYPKRAEAARRRLQPFVPKELTDSPQPDEETA